MPPIAPTFWFDLSIFLFLILVGHITLGHFEAHRPKWRRIGKVVLSAVIFWALWSWIGRFWTWTFFVTFIVVGVGLVHLWWLPNHGVNGWTGEPRERYLALINAKRRG